MKRKVALFICIMMLLSAGLYGCKEQKQENNNQETGSTQSVSDEKKKDILEIHSSSVQPNYELQLYQAEDVILGEVVEELESFYTNPNRDEHGITNAWITPYVIQIEKSYKGLLKEGDTVIVTTWNKVGIYPEDEEKYEIVTNQKEFYLHKGQRGIFMLKDCSKYLATEEMKEVYEIVCQSEGVFEEKISGNASMGEELKKTYVSPSFEITLDQIPADIQKADQHYKN